jgi:hypothetical protein
LAKEKQVVLKKLITNIALSPNYTEVRGDKTKL